MIAEWLDGMHQIGVVYPHSIRAGQAATGAVNQQTIARLLLGVIWLTDSSA